MKESARSVNEIEKEIARRKALEDQPSVLGYLSSMIDLYEELEAALEAEIEALSERKSSVAETARHLRVVKMLTEGGSKTEKIDFNMPFNPSMSTRECIEIVLKEVGDWMSTNELAERISAGGKPLGPQPLSTVTNAMKNNLGTLFVRKKDGRKYLYTLKELVNEGGELEPYKTSTSG